MRILGFSKKWPKLQQEEFTTFRLPRRDRDWQVGEQVQIVYRPRSKEREVLGVAEIVSKEVRSPVRLAPLDGIPIITDEEALADGFEGKRNRFGVWKSPYFVMWEWLWDAHDIRRLMQEPINKLTLCWMFDAADAVWPPFNPKGFKPDFIVVGKA